MLHALAHLWESLRRVALVLLALVSPTLAIVGAAFGLSANVPLWAVLLLVFASAALVLTLGDAFARAWKRVIGGPPKVIQCLEPHVPFDDCEFLFLLESDDAISQNRSVAFWYRDDQGLDRQFGAGTVVNVQANGKVLAAVETVFDGTDTVVGQLRKGESLSRVVVQYNVTARGLEQHARLRWKGHHEDVRALEDKKRSVGDDDFDAEEDADG